MTDTEKLKREAARAALTQKLAEEDYAQWVQKTNQAIKRINQSIRESA